MKIDISAPQSVAIEFGLRNEIIRLWKIRHSHRAYRCDLRASVSALRHIRQSWEDSIR